MSATASFRGTAAEHTAVIWNGFNIANAALGQTDFSLVPVSTANAISIVHGGNSAKYGSGAIGGSIILQNTPSFKPDGHITLSTEYGSFGYNSNVLSLFHAGLKTEWQTTLWNTGSLNNFEFINTSQYQSPKQILSNAAYAQRGFQQAVHIKTPGTGYLTVLAWYNHYNRQIQPNTTAPDTKARQFDENLRLAAIWNNQSTLGYTSLRVGFFNDVLVYQNNNIQSHLQIITYNPQAEHEFRVSNFLQLKLGADAQLYIADNDIFDKKIKEQRGSVYALLQLVPFRKFALNLNIRKPFGSTYDAPFTPTMALQYKLVQKSALSIALKGSVGKSYRLPTLNERFYVPGGNPNILPEQGLNAEGGVSIACNRSHLNLQFEATYYRLEVTNWVQWLQVPGKDYYSPFNLRKVAGNGYEFSAKINWIKDRVKLGIGAVAAITHSVNKEVDQGDMASLNKQLIYVPVLNGHTWLNLEIGNYTFNFNYVRTGLRYTTNDNSKGLPSFDLINISGGKIFKVHAHTLQLLFKINNCTNEIYEVMEYVAMPPRNYSISLILNLNKLSK